MARHSVRLLVLLHSAAFIISILQVATLLPSEAVRPHHASSSGSSLLRRRGSLSSDSLSPNGNGFTRADFPEDFLFGAITSSMKPLTNSSSSQHEGAPYADNKTDNIWDFYARNDGASIDGSQPSECGNNYELYTEDHRLVKALGMDSYRLSLAWSRIYPNGSGEVNQAAIDHYNKVIDDVLSLGLIPMVTLWTQDHPQVLEDLYGGALNDQFITDFVQYADTCFEAFGDRVKYWVTFDEPNDWAGLAYSTIQNPPGRCTPNVIGQMAMNYGACSDGDSGTEPYIVGHNLLLAHAGAVDVYRSKYQATQNGSIGYALWFRWIEPLTNTSADIAAAKRANDFLMGWFLDPIFYGKYPDSMQELVGSRLPSFTAEQIAQLNGSLDFIGLNIQTALYGFETDFYVTQNKTCYYLDWRTDVTGYRDGIAIGEGTNNDFAVPWCIRSAVDYIKEYYNNFPMFITQTGIAYTFNSSEDTLNDEARVKYFETYYTELLAAIRDGANVKGVYAWSLLDGFEYNLGLGIRAGIFYVDDEYNRYPRKSALWFKEMLSSNTTVVDTLQLN
ncbi:hypothetical protein KP509_04G111500 [Ceratopteris richardii]|uniref:Beta-glucosidase n=1 Tax=Ceratopteris richardii TaxID=49495 RepID=A0A8T2V3X5_CERRI|nr:hypothetical protein KP509_04G111500 [Ceratopteris richardii]